jgi:hypothetical protein
MKKLSVLCVALCLGLSTAAIARGGGGSHHSSASAAHGAGGAFGTNPATPGTNSLGTALSSDAVGNGAQKGPLIGTSPAIDREEARVNKMIASICRGCWSRQLLGNAVTLMPQPSGRPMMPGCSGDRLSGRNCPDRSDTAQGVARNHHPTPKKLGCAKYLWLCAAACR